MNKAESEKIHELCSRIAVEHDHKKFLALIQELNRVLSIREDASQENSREQEREDASQENSREQR